MANVLRFDQGRRRPHNPLYAAGLVPNLIIEQSPTIEWYSDLYPLFARIESIVHNHIWLWTDVEVTSELPVRESDRGIYWLSGETLLGFVETRPQFVWSVLSAIPIASEDSARNCDVVPYADGNRALWSANSKPQHPSAVFEVVCWDASATLLIGASSEINTAFRAAYPGCTALPA